jgi:gamma-glutamyltranspeptidase/glutathione hydrolase
MTTSIEAQFGARLMSDGGSGLPGGFLLNNQLTDFSFTPADAQGRPVANRVQPGKRPRSSMSPTLVFDRGSGQLQMVLGSPVARPSSTSRPRR